MKTDLPNKNHTVKIDISRFISNNTDLFRSLPVTAKKKITGRLKKLSVKTGQKIIRQGEEGDALYIVYSGTFNAFADDKGKPKKLGEIISGGCFGEGALITREKRNATITCSRPGIIFKLSHDDFQSILKENPEELESFVALIGKRSRSLNKRKYRPEPGTIKQFLSTIEIYAALDDALLSQLESRLDWVFLPGGEHLMNQGETADGMYMVVNGKLKYEVTNSAQEIVAQGEFSRGDLIGELALLTGEPRSATVYSLRSSELVYISTKTFESVLLKNPDAMFHVTKVIAKRLTGDRTGIKAKSGKNIILTLFPLQRGFSIENFAVSFKKSLNKFGKTFVADKRKFLTSIKSRDNYTLNELLHWLYDLESLYNILIFYPDFTDPVWTEAILHHTDKIYLLSDHKLSPDLSPDEIRYLGEGTNHAPEKELILIYNDKKDKPYKTSLWISQRQLKAVHHLKHFEENDFEKLARTATGNSIGLALGGGGAKGFAHIGLLRAFAEEGIPVDMIGGTSAGAIIAGSYAMGYKIKDIEKIIKNMMSDQKKMTDFTIPVISLIRGKTITDSFKLFTMETYIEDLWIPYFSVATNLTRANKQIIDKGYLWKALRASTSIPGILPPFYNDGELLVDGAMLDNVPGSVMRKKGAGYVISVDLATDTDPERDRIYQNLFTEKDPGISPSALNIIWGKLNIFKKKNDFPGLFNVIMRSTFVASDAAIALTKSDSDLFINLPVEEFGLFDWKKFDQIVHAGYTYGKQHAREWKKQIGIPFT